MNELIFVSAQPDVTYFHWQTKIYIHNFIENGVNPNQIHLLFMVGEGQEPSQESLELKGLGVNIHYFIDERESKVYIPTLRPLMLSKWLKENPEYSKCYFYHDSDIIFKELPDFESLLGDDVCYLSDTKSYIGYDYITMCSGRYKKEHPNLPENELINNMCEIINISPDIVRGNQEKSGGAQYLLKNVDYKFWEKVYVDSEPLYLTLIKFHQKYPIEQGIQMWTSDMWCVLWNLWLFEKETSITDKLSFTWATDILPTYDKNPILHMAGITKNMKSNTFYKGEFTNTSPLTLLEFNIEYFNYVDDNSVTQKYIEVMKRIIKK